MTASLFYEQKYEWLEEKLNPLYLEHKPRECKRAKRFISDIQKLPIHKRDDVYELLILTTCKRQTALVKEGKVPDWLVKVYRRWMRYNDLERDLVEQLIGR